MSGPEIRLLRFGKVVGLSYIILSLLWYPIAVVIGLSVAVWFFRPTRILIKTALAVLLFLMALGTIGFLLGW